MTSMGLGKIAGLGIGVGNGNGNGADLGRTSLGLEGHSDAAFSVGSLFTG